MDRISSDNNQSSVGLEDHAANVANLLVEVASNPGDPRPLTQLGALFARAGRLVESRVVFERALRLDPNNLDALWGLADIEQVLGDNVAALRAQRHAISLTPIVTVNPVVHRGSAKADRPIQVLMLCIPGTFQANTPLEFIADGSQIELQKWYLTGSAQPELPDYDVIFTAIGHDPGLQGALEEAQAFVDSQSRPVINEPRLVPYLARDVLSERFIDSTRIQVAPIERLARHELAQRSIYRRTLARPIESQAGERLALLRSDAERDTYLESTPDIQQYYAMPFVDYRSADGYYRKYRILFIDGEMYPVHLAISPRWMVHYYNAPMGEHRWMRAEEESFLNDISSVFSGEKAEALAELAEALPFGYFAIDCGIAPDGRVMLFEADTAMLVHMQDVEEPFAYKRRYMERISDAVTMMFARRSPHHSAATLPLSAFDSDLDLDEPRHVVMQGSFPPDAAMSFI